MPERPWPKLFCCLMDQIVDLPAVGVRWRKPERRHFTQIKRSTPVRTRGSHVMAARRGFPDQGKPSPGRFSPYMNKQSAGREARKISQKLEAIPWGNRACKSFFLYGAYFAGLLPQPAGRAGTRSADSQSSVDVDSLQSPVNRL